MKRITFLFVAILSVISFLGYSQIPESFNYQAVIRDKSGELVVDQSISIRLSVLEESETGTQVYTETHDVITDAHGAVSLKVGEGTTTDSFSGIDWTSAAKFIKVDVDVLGGTEFVNVGVSELVSVPYALFANNVVNKDDADADSLNEIQDLNMSSNILTITNNPNATSVDLAPFQGVNTDNQVIDLTDTELSISGGNMVDLSPLQDGVDDADNNPLNEIQNLLLDGDTLRISNGNNVTLPYDNSTWQKDGDILFVKEGNVGIGTDSPNSKLEVQGDTAVGATDTLFSVKDKNGNVIFAVFPDGVKVIVDQTAKGNVGGFAVSGRNPGKAGDVSIFSVTPDSTRVYVNNLAKGNVGGFAVSGRNPGKGITEDILTVNSDSTRVYVNNLAKGNVGGFAVSGRNPGKAGSSDILTVSADSTRIFTSNTTGGFGVRDNSTGTSQSYLQLLPENYFIGHNSGRKTTGLYNSFIGYESGSNNIVGANNVFLGYKSGYTNSGGNNNTFLGHVAGHLNLSGSNNVFLGDSSGYNNNTGEQNIFLGNGSGKANTDGNYNAFIGFRAGHKNLTGLNNAFIGYQAGYTNETGNNNAFIGYQAGWNTYKGSKNVFIGYQAGFKNEGQIEGVTHDGNNNIYIGDQSAYNNKTGRSNVYIGHGAGLGSSPINEGDPPRFNVYIGYKAGFAEYEGRNNTFIGYEAGYDNNTGDYLTFIGFNAGHSNTSGGNNVYIGYNAGVQNTEGSNNLFLGDESGFFNILGSNNVFIGKQAGYYETGSEKLFIDNQKRVNEATSRTRSLIYGEFNATVSNQFLRINGELGIGREPGTNDLEVEGTASKTTAGEWVANSDKRIKTDIKDIENSFDVILKLRPVKFKYTEYWKEKHPSIKDQYYYNFIAQEYQQVFPESVNGSGEFIEGDKDEILQLDSYNAQIVTIKAVQELIKENNELKATLEDALKRIGKLENE